MKIFVSLGLLATLGAISYVASLISGNEMEDLYIISMLAYLITKDFMEE